MNCLDVTLTARFQRYSVCLYNQAKSAKLYHTKTRNAVNNNKNIVIRKKRGFLCGALYEWRTAITSAFNVNRWYFINRKNIVCTTGFEQRKKLLHCRTIREFFNWLLQGKVIQISGFYCKATKTLCVDIYNFKIIQEVK